MFSLIRGVVIIGLIFYFSPARNAAEPESRARSRETVPSPQAELAEGSAEGLWNRLVASVAQEAVRTTVNAKTQEAALRLKEVSWSPSEPPAKPAPVEPGRSAERDAARTSQGSAQGQGPGVRCIYRCDGTE